MRIRAYTLTVHAGHAPCWMYDKRQGREVLSLANCKPLIRSVAPVGEWVAGVTSKDMGCWVRQQPRLKLNDSVVLRDFGNKGCGCCHE
jgi:hypothetical protein